MSAVEQNLFAIVSEVARQHGVIVRLAGGWVRDKLLGKESSDYDFAVQNIAPLEFADAIN